MTDLAEVIKKKERLLEENPDYKKHEALYHRRTAGKYIGDLIYGANDGIITTFAVVSGAAGAALSPSIVIILGFANILADGISMGASNYLGRKSEQDYAKSQRQKEQWEIENLREIEIAEIREIFTKKGFKGKDLERAVEIVTEDEQVWVDMMMKEELGILEEFQEDPAKHGFITFAAFSTMGLIPLLPYIIPNIGIDRFILSIIIGAATLFTVGALRSTITTVSWIRGGLEMLILGSVTATSAYLIGDFIENLIK